MHCHSLTRLHTNILPSKITVASCISLYHSLFTKQPFKSPALSSSSHTTLPSTQSSSYPTPLRPNRKAGKHLLFSAASENNSHSPRRLDSVCLSPLLSVVFSLALPFLPFYVPFHKIVKARQEPKYM